MIQKTQFGRSMIEMLGVLAIIGVLSVGGLAGYSKAMTNYKANEIIDYVQRAWVEARSVSVSGTSINMKTCESILGETKPSFLPSCTCHTVSGALFCFVQNFPAGSLKTALSQKVGISSCPERGTCDGGDCCEYFMNRNTFIIYGNDMGSSLFPGLPAAGSSPAWAHKAY